MTESTDTPAQSEPPTDSTHPVEAVEQELRSYLEKDPSRLGDVYRGFRDNLRPDEISAQLDVATSNFVWNYTQILRALLEGDLPDKPSVAIQVARKFRAILKRGELTLATREYLASQLVKLERRADDVVAREAETEEALEQTTKAEARNEVGIYVYALPHYLRYPFDPDTGRTLMKVGRSDSDVIRRFRAQTRTTALPEEPILLRIYRVDGQSTAEIESGFHRLLEAADHARSVARTAGREWFVTSIRFLDEIARVLKLVTIVVNDAETDDD